MNKAELSPQKNLRNIRANLEPMVEAIWLTVPNHLDVFQLTLLAYSAVSFCGCG